MNDRHTRERRKAALKTISRQPKGWHHQRELEDLIGKQIRITTSHGTWIGELVAADQFTVKIDMKGVNGCHFVVLFKSAMTYFHALKQEIQDV